MLGKLRAYWMLFLFALYTPVVASTQYLILKTGIGNRRVMPRSWHRYLLWLLDFRVHVNGEMSRERPLLLVGNHISWTDIMVLGSLGDVNFIAKSDVKKWPIFGPLSKLQNTVYVDRERRRGAAGQASEISRRMVAGDAMVLFAEGTTGDGNQLAPFKTSLFAAASIAVEEGAAERVLIQPVSTAYTRLHGMPMSRAQRALVSWVGSKKLLPHIMQLLQEGGVDVEVTFGEPVEYSKGVNRKLLAQEVERRVQTSFYNSLREPARSRR